jgi:hypothetical protein
VAVVKNMQVGMKMKKMEEFEKSLLEKIWSHENRNLWRQKGAGLINFRSRLEAPNPISAEIEGILGTRLCFSNRKSGKKEKMPV